MDLLRPQGWQEPGAVTTLVRAAVRCCVRDLIDKMAPNHAVVHDAALGAG
jgi:hypothetical protein